MSLRNNVNHFVTNSKKRTKLAWGSYKARAAMDRVLYLQAKHKRIE